MTDHLEPDAPLDAQLCGARDRSELHAWVDALHDDEEVVAIGYRCVSGASDARWTTKNLGCGGAATAARIADTIARSFFPEAKA